MGRRREYPSSSLWGLIPDRFFTKLWLLRTAKGDDRESVQAGTLFRSEPGGAIE
jgi:hypothetical protein